MRSLLVSLALAGVLGVSSLVQAQGSDATIEIVEPGEGPRAALRHRFVAGVSQPVTLRVQSQMRMALGSRVQMVPVPIMRMDLELGATEVANGHLRYPYRITAVGISGGENESMNAQVEEQMGELIGCHGVAEVDEQGAIVDFTFEVPEGADPELARRSRLLRDSLSQLMPRFPTEPIGVGGSWRVIHELPLPNMTVRVGTTYTLTSRQGDLIELDVRTAVLEDAPNPAQIDVSGSGRLRFQIGTLRLYGRVQTVAAAQIRGPQGFMRMRIRSRMQITPR